MLTGCLGMKGYVVHKEIWGEVYDLATLCGQNMCGQIVHQFKNKEPQCTVVMNLGIFRHTIHNIIKNAPAFRNTTDFSGPEMN